MGQWNEEGRCDDFQGVGAHFERQLSLLLKCEGVASA